MGASRYLWGMFVRKKRNKSGTISVLFIGLLVATGGYPIGYEVFKGNIYEGDTIIPLIQRLSAKFELGKPIVVADSGLLSKKNIKALTDDGYEFILGARIKSESEAVRVFHRLENRIKGHVCVCFTAYSIMLELERILKESGSRITVSRAQELLKNMYAINVILPDSHRRQAFCLEMDDEQSELCRLVGV